MFGRFCYSLFPAILSAATFVLTVVSFLGSYKTNVLPNLYFLRLDFTNLNLDGIKITSSDTGLYPVYQVGANAYCWGNEDEANSSSISLVDCSTPTTPYYFDITEIIEGAINNSTLAKDSDSTFDIPSELTGYQSVVKGVSYAMWACYIAVICLSFLLIVLGLFSACSRVLSCCITMIASITAVIAIVLAGVATGMFKVYSGKFNEIVTNFGVSAKTGPNLILTWIIAALSIVTWFFWTFLVCCGSSSRTKETTVVQQVPMNFNSGYAPAQRDGHFPAYTGDQYNNQYQHNSHFKEY